MKCLVTGGTGFIGSNLALRLQQKGHDVTITSIEGEQKLPEFKGKRIKKRFSFLEPKDLEGIDILFHQGAISDATFLDREEMFKINCLDAIKLFKMAIKVGCRRIVYASSIAIFGNARLPFKEKGPKNPLNPYSEAKLILNEKAMSLATEHPGCMIVGLSYCSSYGPRENHKGKRSSVIYQLAQQMKKEKRPQIFKFGDQTRDYIYIKDVVEANLLAAKTKESCVLNCGFGKLTTFNNVVKILNEVSGKNLPAQYINNPYGESYQEHMECEISLAKEKIGFIPKYNIEKGIKDYYESGFLF